MRTALVSGAVLSLSAALLAPPARAANETTVLTAADTNDPFDIDIDFTWDRSQRRGKVSREWIQDAGNGTLQAIDVKELRYTRITNTLIMGLRVGLYHDIEAHVYAPIVLSEDTDIGLAAGVEGRSTVCCSPNADDPGYPAAPRYPITAIPDNRAERFRGGFGDMTFGLAWSPFVDWKDEAYPTITLKADVTAPTGGSRDPTDQATLTRDRRGGVSNGVTLFDLSIGASRRMSAKSPAFDPYVVLGAELPVATSKLSSLGMEPPFAGRFQVGTEIVMYDDESTHQDYRLDISFTTRYVGPGRTYSELSDFLPNFDQTRTLANRTAAGASPDQILYSDYDDPRNYASMIAGASCGKITGVPCGELTKVDQYLGLKGSFVAHLGFAEYAYIRTGVTIEHNTDHFLTNERVGKDQDPSTATNLACDGPVGSCVGRVNARNSYFDRMTNTCNAPAGQTCDERSKYYDPRYDAPGRRFRLEESANFTFFITGVATF